MLCQKCNKNFATTIITRTKNGATTTMHMCSDCALKAGYTNFFGNFSLNHLMPDFERSVEQQLNRCHKCNSTFNELISNGELGCSECYNTFRNELMPSIENIHGKAYHVGKKPARYSKTDESANMLDELKIKIDKAIEIQDFETAAVIRDEIKKLEK